MSAWYVGRLLLDSTSIRSKIMEVGNYSTSLELDDDLYSDLLSVEMAIEKLYKINLINKRELEIINRLKMGISFRNIEKDLKLSRPRIYHIFREVCTKVAFYLGEHFTNEGYVEYMSFKYSLTDEDIECMCKTMRGI
jgi:hypothetical protein